MRFAIIAPPVPTQKWKEVVSSSSGAGVRLILLGYHDFSAGTLSPSQPGLALTGRVEASLLYDLYSVGGGVKLLQKPKKKNLILGTFMT